MLVDCDTLTLKRPIGECCKVPEAWEDDENENLLVRTMHYIDVNRIVIEQTNR